MHTDELMLQALTHLGDGQRGSVGGEDGVFLAQSVQTAQQLLLGGHILGNALDDQVGIGGSLNLLHQDAAHDVISSFLSHLAAGDLLVQRGSQLILMTLSAGDAGSIHQSGVTLCGKDLSDTAAHSTCTKDCDFHDSSS